MCFSMEMSYGISAAAALSAYALHRKGAPKSASVPVFYFGAMEAIQGTQYLVINQCGHGLNVFLIYLAYLHICFQPYVFNLWVTFFIENKKKAEIFWKYTSRLCLIGAAFMLSRVWIGPYNMCPAGSEVFCAIDPCAYTGNLHISWQLPLRDAGYLTPSIFIHFFLWFVPAIVIGKLWLSALIFATGPVLSKIMTDDINEQPVIWCIFSTIQMLITYRFYLLWKRRRSDEAGDERPEVT